MMQIPMHSTKVTKNSVQKIFPSLKSSVAGEAAYNLRLQLTCGKAGS